MLGKRVVSAAVLIPVVLGAIYLGSWAFLGLVALATALACYEFLCLVRQPGHVRPYWPALCLALVFMVDGQWPHFGLLGVAALFGPLALLTVEVFSHNRPGALNRWALSTAGALYIGLSASCFLRLRNLDAAGSWLLLALATTWICDTGAYIVGMRWGKRRFFPDISPKKTWEGAIGGLVSGTVATTLLGLWLVDLPWYVGALLGVLVSLAATFGDLAESVIKRQVGVKDSGNLIPGHGGMLDRIDSLLFVAPMAYSFVVLMNLVLPRVR